LKAYAKYSNLVRLELKAICCAGPLKLLGVTHDDPASMAECRAEDLRSLLQRVVLSGQPVLARLQAHLAEVRVMYANPVPLLSAFSPLWAISHPAMTRTGPSFSPETLRLADQVFEELVMKGSTRPVLANGSALKANHPVRRALDEMCRGETPILRVESARYGRHYVLLPRYAPAQHMLQLAFAPRLHDLINGNVEPANDP
jgi:hypothetical protein